MNKRKGFRHKLGPLTVSRIVPSPSLYHRRFETEFWKVSHIDNLCFDLFGFRFDLTHTKYSHRHTG